VSEAFEYRGLGDSVAKKLRDDVLSGRYKAGEQIVEREVAEQLGLSRGPIRDALRQLHNEGLVTIAPRRGARVASLSREDTAQTIEIRASEPPRNVRRPWCVPGSTGSRYLDSGA
jgi:DNA-binding GntR family transcriptional regulator